CLTPLKIPGGTAMTFQRNLNREYATVGAAEVVFGDALTVSVLTNADYVGVNKGFTVSGALTTGLVNVGGPSNEIGYNFMNGAGGVVPHVLTKGAAMIIYTYTAGSDAVWRGYMQWAELEPGDLY
ncbi:hypothetical protein LCGC14_1610070, partial [marine sediment metagenome]